MTSVRKIILILATCGWLACWAQGDPAVDLDSVNAEWAMVDNANESEEEGNADNGDANADSINTDSIIAAASKFTPEELNSPMMNVSTLEKAKGNDRFKLVDWCFDHLFLSGLLALLLAYGGTWVVYRICRNVFIKPKKP